MYQVDLDIVFVAIAIVALAVLSLKVAVVVSKRSAARHTDTLLASQGERSS